MTSDYAQWKGWSADSFGHFGKGDMRYFSWHIRRALGSRDPKRVLELGFGNGNFLGYCRHRGWQADGIEAIDELQARARHAGFDVHASVRDVPTSTSYDLVAAFDVLEHMCYADAEALLMELKSHLAPGGAIILRVPNGDSPFGRVHQYGDHTHLEVYGESKLRQLGKPLGLVVAHVGEAPWQAQQHGGRSGRTLVRAMTRRCIERVLGFAYFNRRVDWSPNLLVVMTAEPAPNRP